MSFQINILPSGRTFTCDNDETILSAALRAEIGLPYGCKNGVCASCKGKVHTGTIFYPAHLKKILTQEDELNGYALFCCARPQSDLTIEVRETPGFGDIPIKKLPTRIIALERASEDVMILSLQLPNTEKLLYKAGQYIEFILKDGKRRSYSMANAPHLDLPLTLHIRHLPGGLFTDKVFSTLKEKDILRIEGPMGNFSLDEESNKPIILIATSTGFAPIKAIIEQSLHLKLTRPMTLYWGAHRPQDLYMDALCKAWQATHAHFNYVPVLSRAQPEDQWSGRAGYAHHAIMKDHPDLRTFQVYACGSPAMINAAKTDLTLIGHLPKSEFFADSFISEADLNP